MDKQLLKSAISCLNTVLKESAEPEGMFQKFERLERLELELAQEKEAHRITKVFLTDDIEKLRVKALRNSRENLSLLTEGLHALNRTPPKVHVMIDHAERVIESITNLDSYLQNFNVYNR